MDVIRLFNAIQGGKEGWMEEREEAGLYLGYWDNPFRLYSKVIGFIRELMNYYSLIMN